MAPYRPTSSPTMYVSTDRQQLTMRVQLFRGAARWAERVGIGLASRMVYAHADDLHAGTTHSERVLCKCSSDHSRSAICLRQFWATAYGKRKWHFDDNASDKHSIYLRNIHALRPSSVRLARSNLTDCESGQAPGIQMPGRA